MPLRQLLQNYQITKFQRHTQQLSIVAKIFISCYRTIRLQNFKDIHNVALYLLIHGDVVIELLDYKISKTYTTQVEIDHTVTKLLQNYQITKFQRHTQRMCIARNTRQGCYRTIRLQNFKDIHNTVQGMEQSIEVVIELLDYKISKTKMVYFKKMLQRYYFFLKYANEY